MLFSVIFICKITENTNSAESTIQKETICFKLQICFAGLISHNLTAVKYCNKVSYH